MLLITSMIDVEMVVNSYNWPINPRAAMMSLALELRTIFSNTVCNLISI